MTETKVYLGFEDEQIQDKHKNDVTYTTNKLGGVADWPPPHGLEFDSKCGVCCLPRPLVLQCYAPLPESPYHRTLYVFGCINPSCWNNSNSWSCVRSQCLDLHYENKINSKSLDQVKSVGTSDPWCTGADEWGDDDSIENPDVSNVFSDQASNNFQPCGVERMSDSDDAPSEMEQIEACVGNIHLSNNSTGKCDSSRTMASAEIDGDASEVIADFPALPENNIFTLLTQVPELPATLQNGMVQFDAKFIAVDEEHLEVCKSDHVKKLLEQYQKENEDDLKRVNKAKGKSSKGGDGDVEEYERAVPLHGDELFHNFLTRIQVNPTQILRYSWGGQPLPMSPIPASLLSKKCLHCGGEIWFELQILPTIIPSLKICDSPSTHLEFGTVLVFTCKKSCWRDNDKVLMETIFVQSEPL